MSIEVLILIFCLILISVLYFGFLKFQKRLEKVKNDSRENEKILLKQFNDAQQEAAVWQDRNISFKQDNELLKKELQQIRNDNLILVENIGQLKTENNNYREKQQSQKVELEDIQKRFTIEFENLAAGIMKKNSKEFTLYNKQNIDDLLTPLKEKIILFEKKIEDTYQKGLKDQTDLRAELKKLYDLNNRISEEAGNLTNALKGDVKKQGDWGEVVLERILESSGLNEGAEGYQTQYSDVTENGKRIQPDVVVNLPDNKHIIIDSKVSLVAYERAINAKTEDEREQNVKKHLQSLRTHIKGLSDKHYQTARSLNSPDFVLLFIPIEASFSLAVNEDQELFSYAWDQKVVIVSPSTLLATLRTIASIWQQKNQTRNAIEIARQGGALYDKFVGFITDMEKIGNNLRLTQNCYKDAMNKLSEGRGNLVRSTEKLREMGAKATKEIPKKMLEN